MYRSLPTLLICLALLTLGACSNEQAASDCSQLTIENAWVREAPPGVTVLAGYMRIRNEGRTVATITSAQSPSAKRIEFHQTTMNNGSMKMQALPVLEIPAQSVLTLEPGGRHMMLFNPDRDYRDGDSLGIEIRCASQESSKVDFLVKKTNGDGSVTHQHHQHHQH